MPKKFNLKERVDEARKQLEKETKTLDEIKTILSECLEEKRISGEIITTNPSLTKINYEEIRTKYDTNGAGHLIWIQFTQSGHVAVVGAGKDIGFPKNPSRGTALILSKIKEEKPEAEWDTNKVILIPIKGLDRESYGLKNIHKHGNNVLKCRNGVEHCIGEYLIKKGVPVLNLYQHKNYSDKFWGNCEKNNYIRT